MEPTPPTEEVASQAVPPRTLEQLFRALESPLLAYAMRLTRQADAAQDCVQEAFLRLHPRLAAGEVVNPAAWLYRTIHNLAISDYRASRRLVPFETPAHSAESETRHSPHETIPDPAPLPDAEVERAEASGLARLFLERLDPRSRQIVQLKFDENLSYKDIAARTGLTVGHVGYLLHHALKQLALELNRAGLSA
jgi:RNA polymerase sigma-70 factor (ECF subfamily)